MNADIMTLYHGSNVQFEQIDLSKAKPGKDFGKGFYVTTNKEQAISWATRNPNKTGFLYIYELDDNSLLIDFTNYKIRVLTTYNKEWADYISLCRYEFFESGDDIVYDRMADSRYQILSDAISDYYFKLIDLPEFLSYAKFANLDYDQYCFKTQRVVDQLILIERVAL